MPRASKALLRASVPAAGVLAAAALALPVTASPATADPMAPGTPLGGPVKWSAELGPVPRAATNTAPALAHISVAGKTPPLLLFWTGPAQRKNGSQIFYQTSISLPKNQWSRPGLVDDGKALTLSRVSAAPFGAASSGQVIVTWKDASSPQILYSVGQAGQGNALSWPGGIVPIPGAMTSTGPAVYRPRNSDAILVAWKAAKSNAIDVVVGFVTAAGGVKWGNVGVIRGAATTGTPAIAEVTTARGSGRVYVLWRAPGAGGPIDFAATSDPVSGSPRWTTPRTLPSRVRAGAAPSAQAIGKGASYPLLVVFRALRGSALIYVTLAKSGGVTGPFGVPHLRSLNGTAISRGALAAEAPDPGKIFYVRPCPGC